VDVRRQSDSAPFVARSSAGKLGRHRWKAVAIFVDVSLSAHPRIARISARSIVVK
jgi:hypothetical protein